MVHIKVKMALTKTFQFLFHWFNQFMSSAIIQRPSQQQNVGSNFYKENKAFLLLILCCIYVCAAIRNKAMPLMITLRSVEQRPLGRSPVD